MTTIRLRESPSGPPVFISDTIVGPGQVLGLPENAPGPDEAIALTAQQLVGIIDQEAVSWTGTQRFLSNVQLGTQQNESGALPLAGTVNNTTNRLYFLISGDGQIQTLTPASGVNDVGRLVKCYIVGTGIKRIRHSFSGGGVGRIQCPNNIDYYIGNRGSFDLIGDGSNGWLLMNPSAGATSITLSVVVPAVAASTLAYLDVSLAATGFAGLTANQAVCVSPQADLAAAALNGGYFVGARMSATDTLRMAFFGTLAGGAANFTITKLGP